MSFVFREEEWVFTLGSVVLSLSLRYSGRVNPSYMNSDSLLGLELGVRPASCISPVLSTNIQLADADLHVYFSHPGTEGLRENVK
jgi:hypothetical protein